MSGTGRKQPTLAAFGFTKSVVTPTGSNVRLHLNNYVESEDNEEGKTGVVCPYCTGGKRTITSIQYLNHHITYNYKHPNHENITKTTPGVP